MVKSVGRKVAALWCFVLQIKNELRAALKKEEDQEKQKGEEKDEEKF